MTKRDWRMFTVLGSFSYEVRLRADEIRLIASNKTPTGLVLELDCGGGGRSGGA
jgi:hypothetical protein